MILESSNVSHDQSKEWSRGIAISDEAEQLSGHDNETFSRKAYSIRETIEKAYIISGGTLSTLKILTTRTMFVLLQVEMGI